MPIINHLIIVIFFSLFGGWGGGGVVSCLFFILLRLLLTLCRWFCYDETWATLIARTARTARTEVRFQRSLVIKFHIIKEWTFPFYIRWQAIIRINCKISVNNTSNHKKIIFFGVLYWLYEGSDYCWKINIFSPCNHASSVFFLQCPLLSYRFKTKKKLLF